MWASVVSEAYVPVSLSKGIVENVSLRAPHRLDDAKEEQ